MPCGNVCLLHSDASTDYIRTLFLHSEVGIQSPYLSNTDYSCRYLRQVSVVYCIGTNAAISVCCLRAETAVLTDDRIRTMNEVISGIRVIKMYGWEKPFAALVDEVRR